MEEEKIIEELAQLPAEPEKSEAELELMRLEPVLSALKKLYGEDWSPEAVALLRRVDAADCPFQSEGEGTAFVHGDCCLPNVMIYRGKVSGFVDLGQAGRGDPWQDYAWCLWSLDYNLKTDAYRERLLQRLGIALDEEKYAKFLQ